MPFVAETSTEPRSQAGRQPVDGARVDGREELAREGRPAAATRQARERADGACGRDLEREQHRRSVHERIELWRYLLVVQHDLPFVAWREKRRYEAVARIDPDALAAFQSGIRKRYSDEQILAELRSYAEPARPLADDEGVRGRPGDARAPADGDRALRHLERRQAGGRARPAPLRDPRGAARASCARLGAELGRMPTARDLDERRGRLPSKSLYWHTFGSLSAALREAGYDVAVGEERLERAVEQGVGLAQRARPAARVRRLGRRPPRRRRRC